MAAGRQLRLLLWKDYLVRKRKPITLAGIVWATLVMMCLYVVRINVDNQDFPTCQFPARALPSAGMLTFLQSFICSVNNDCSPMDQFQEIPTYENSKLTQLRRQFSPMLQNETVLQVAGTVPGALKLLATLANVLDDPDMLDISKNGLEVQALFSNPGRVRRALARELNVSEAAAASLMGAKLSVAVIFKGNLDRCDADSMSSLLQMDNLEHLAVLEQRLCELSDDDLQKIASNLMVEINFGKYITMISNMYYKLSGDERAPGLARMAAGAARLARPDSYLPPSVAAMLLHRDAGFSYFNVSWIGQLVDQLEPAFGGTEAFKSLRDVSEVLTVALDYLDQLFRAKPSEAVKQAAGLALGMVGEGGEGISQAFDSAVDVFERAGGGAPVDVFKILTQIMNAINKFLPAQTQHEVLLYSTLLAKLIECAQKVVPINLNIQDMAYQVSLRNPEGLQVLRSLPADVVRKGFEGLADAERVQILTSKLNTQGQVFCDTNKLAGFFRLSKAEAGSLKVQLCTDAWKHYIGDLMTSLGIYEVKDIVNNMLSILVQETFGKDVSSQLYTIEQDVAVLQNFTQALLARGAPVERDWGALLNLTEDSPFMKVFRERRQLGTQILITVHGALAKEIVKQNAILDFKISPILLDFTTIITAARDQLAAVPGTTTELIRRHYPAILETMLATLMNEEKTYKALSTPSKEVFCAGTAAASAYLELPVDGADEVVRAMCGAAEAFEDTLDGDSVIAKAISSVKASTHGPFDEVDWTALIDAVKQVHSTLDEEYPYLFRFATFGMEEEQQKMVQEMMEDARKFWFGLRKMDKGLHLSMKVVFLLLDVADHAAFGASGEGWLRMKYAFHAATGPLEVVDDLIKLLFALSHNASYSSHLPVRTSAALAAIVPEIPQLVVDAVDLLVNRNVDLEPIMELMNASPAWPCSNRSLADLLPISGAGAVRAIEHLMCLDSGVKEEWLEYVRMRNISVFNSTAYQTTAFPAHTFLRFSRVFDDLVQDTSLVRKLVQALVNDSKEGDRLTMVGAWEYAAEAIGGEDREEILRHLFTSIDRILNATTTAASSKSASALWEEYASCGADCAGAWREAWRGTLQALSVIVRDAASDLLTYFTEINEPDANLLQMVGFTRSTGLYALFDRLPELVAALLNSYWDYGFMTQVRRAALTDFWDCNAVLSALAPAPSSPVDEGLVRRIQPFVCPSLLYWISLPRGENTFLDIVAKPQYTFYTLPADNLTSSFEDAFNKTTALSKLLASTANKTTAIPEEDTKLATLQKKLKQTVDMVINYSLDANDPAYRLFNEINKKQFMAATYLTRITVMVNKIAVAIENMTANDIKEDISDDEAKKLQSELAAISKIFKRRPSEAIALHFDVITNLLTSEDESFDLAKAFDEMCEDFRNNVTSKDILIEATRTKNQICSKQYKVIYGAVKSVVEDDYEAAKKSLFNLVHELQDGSDETVNVFEFFRNRQKLLTSLKSSIRYSYDLSLPVYLQYLHSNLQGYGVVLSFLGGGAWWRRLRAQYRGPRAAAFLDALEMSLEVAADVLAKLDEIHLVRLSRDANDTSSFCRSPIPLGEYVPDATGALSRLKEQACGADKTELFRELPPLLFASQGYDDNLRLSKDIDYPSVYADIAATEDHLEAIRSGPSVPQRPPWATDERLARLKTVASDLLSNEFLTKIFFGVLGNVVDASTLFLNNTQCSYCSALTTAFKQLNLQLYKKQEYEALLCQLPAMSLSAVHLALHNDFHWDMALRELVSFRNYTKLELNRSINELIAQVKLHLLEDVSAGRSRLADCLAPTGANGLGYASLLLKVLSRTMTLFRAELPYLHEVEGMTHVPVLQELRKQTAPRLDAFAPLRVYLRSGGKLREELRGKLGEETGSVMEADVNLRLVRTAVDEKSLHKYLRSPSNGTQWSKLCERQDCSQIVALINRHVNDTLVAIDLPKLQEVEFWKFEHIASLMAHVERVLELAGQLLGVGGRADAPGLARGELAATLDAVLELTTEDAVRLIHESIHGILREVAPLVQDSDLQHDLVAFTEGLGLLREYREELAADDIRVPVGSLWPDPGALESALAALGINDTNFWSLAAPRLYQGYILLKPLLSWKSGDHIGSLVCSPEGLRSALEPSPGEVSEDDVLAATADQLCKLGDATAKKMLSVLATHANYSYVLEQITSFILPKLYSASNLTLAEGTAVVEGLPLVAEVLPAVRAQVGGVAESLSGSPLLRALANFSSVGGLLESGEFLSQAGSLVCGKPLVASVPRLFRSALAGADRAAPADERQLQLLPTEFCRSLYHDIVSVEGGKIVWSFVKPLLMGRVLYTPASPLVSRIIHTANSTFAHMARLASLVHSFADSFPAVDRLADHRAGVGVLSRLLTAPTFEDLRTMLLPEGEASVDLEGMLDEFGDLTDVGKVLTKVSNLVRCVNLDRFHPVNSEEELEKEAARLTMLNEFTAGLVFLNSEGPQASASNVQYKIRMDIENAPTTSRLKSFLWIPGPEANFLENMRYFRGFVQVQSLVDGAVVTTASATANRPREATRGKRQAEKPVGDWAVYTQQAPYPCYRKDFFQTSLYESQALIAGFFFSLLFTVAAAVRFIVADHESGNAMMMHVMGVDLSLHTLSWFLWSSLEMLATGVCVTLVLCAGGVLPRTDPSLVFLLVVVFGFSVLCFCYMMSKLFSKASFAAVCAAIAYLVSFMPIVLILSLEAVISYSAKLVICLSMSSALSYAFLHITRLEAAGIGASWSTVWDASDASDVSVGLAAVMMLVAAALYVAIGWTIGRFFGLRRLQSNIIQCTSTEEKGGVSVVNVSKSYRGVRALHNACAELQQGQVTALLGHNGAGKSTLINILTGMAQPSSGHVVIRGTGDAGGLGVCAQRDILIPHMTPREHVALYARLKRGGDAARGGEVARMLQVLSLGEIADEPVSRLSGGMRRRLCVALAFVGEPHLVTLDEPTAGVDPRARREIWAMIERLKEGRTILLTTHHLDEADLLSDQIIILHKGEVHTTGSPIEIKRTLGSGYKLSVYYDVTVDADVTAGADVTGDASERCAALVRAVRGVVRAAALVDAHAHEVTMTLPFFDADGLNNDFLKLCTTLESNQSALGFSSYSLECSSLEQVLHSVCQPTEEPVVSYDPAEELPSKSASTASVRTESGPLVGLASPTPSRPAQLLAMRYIHYKRNRWLLFVLLVLPALFVGVAMGFSCVRPPPDNERALLLHPSLYADSTDYLVPQPSIYSDHIDPTFAQTVMEQLMNGRSFRNWTAEDTPACRCTGSRQACSAAAPADPAGLLLLPDVDTLNDWLVRTQDQYREKRYGGFTSTLSSNATYLIAWYNNKGHHALPAFVSALHSAVLRATTGDHGASITTYSHPLKISKEQISKDTVYQQVADAGVSGLVVIAYSLASAGAAIYLVNARVRQEKRLQLLSGVSPAHYWAAALGADMLVIVINMVLTAILMEAFHFPVFVERSNLAAICLLILLYGFACSCLVHVAEKLFSEASVANMLLFCGNAFLGLGGITVLLILDIISDSDRTDHARWVLHKLFLLSPQFALGDGLLEIAKNTIQAKVLSRFGMDTYQDPLTSDLVLLHYVYLVLVGVFFFLLNLAIEYQCFDFLLAKFQRSSAGALGGRGAEEADVSAERARVAAGLARGERPLRLRTLGNINAGFIDTEGKPATPPHAPPPDVDVAACAALTKLYRSRRGARAALVDLTLGIPPGQCTALLGENGAGKSTTFALLTGQLRPSAGSIYLGGRPLSGPQLATGLISYCPQSDAVDPLLTVHETLSLYCRLRGIADEDEVIKRTLSTFALSRYGGAAAGALSGGNRRKLCAALAFMSCAPLVLLDEPTSGMDPVSRACVASAARAAVRGGRGVVVSTHALGDARALAARVALLRHGRLRALASLDDCIHRFGGGYVVEARVCGGGGGGGGARRAWAAVAARAPHARARLLHPHALHFLLPATVIVNDKEITTRPSDVFRLMAELQGTCDIEDYTVTQSSLEQMFLSCSDDGDFADDEPLSADLTTVTAL